MTPSEITTLRTALAEANAEIERLREALGPFEVIARELFARNYNKSDKVFSISGRSADGYRVELSLTFEAFYSIPALLNQKDATDGE